MNQILKLIIDLWLEEGADGWVKLKDLIEPEIEEIWTFGNNLPNPFVDKYIERNNEIIERNSRHWLMISVSDLKLLLNDEVQGELEKFASSAQFDDLKMQELLRILTVTSQEIPNSRISNALKDFGAWMHNESVLIFDDETWWRSENRKLIETVKKNVPILDYAKRHIKLKEQRKYYAGVSPFSDDEGASLTVFKHRQIFKCWSSGYAGDVLKLAMLIEKEIEIEDAVQLLSQLYGFDI